MPEKKYENNLKRAIDTGLDVLRVSDSMQQTLLQKATEEQKMKKKMPIALALAMVLALALCGIAIAESLNLFDHFGQHDDRIQTIAQDAVLKEQSAITVESVQLGATTAVITNAYYDGQSLIVAYAIENGTRTEPFTPTEEQFSRMTKIESQIGFIATTDAEAQLNLEYIEACEKGEPFGLVHYSVYPSDHTTTSEGVDLPPITETMDNPDGGTMVYYLREYESPLPEEACNLETLNVEMPLYQSVSYLWFDGANYYTMSENRQDAGVMKATVWRTDAETKSYTGQGEYEGHAVSASATASAVRAAIRITSEDAAFEALSSDLDSWYDAYVTDQNGNKLRVDSIWAMDDHTLTIDLEGTGELPQSLTVRIFVESEGEFDRASAIENAAPILLLPQ